MNTNWPDDLQQIRGVMSMPQLLLGSDGAVLIDTGFPGDIRRIRSEMERRGLGPRDLKAILLTHGHIDHSGNAAELRAWSGAPVYAHPADQAHLDGKHPYRGLAWICGVMEAVGRTVTRYEPIRIDVPLGEGDVLPFWGGLRVLHLPGHTVGHCGFYSARHDLLFSGDLWVRFMMRTQASPAVFSDDVTLVPGSMRKARALGARWMVPGHYDTPNATRLRWRFEQLCEEMERRESVRVV